MGKFSEYFNSTTIRGRANVAKATYASIATFYILNRIRKGRKKTDSPPPTEAPLEDPLAKQEAAQKIKPIEDEPKCQCPYSESNTPIVKAEENTTKLTQEDNDVVPESELSPGPNSDRKSSMSADSHDEAKQDIAVASVGEAIIKSAKGKCESGCGPEFVSTNKKIEQKYLRLYDDDINFWW